MEPMTHPITTLKDVEHARNCLNLLWACYSDVGIMPHGMIQSRVPKTMEEVRRFGKGSTIYYFEKYPNRLLDYDEIIQYKRDTEEAVLEIQRRAKIDAVIAKVKAALTEEEYNMFVEAHQLYPRG